MSVASRQQKKKDCFCHKAVQKVLLMGEIPQFTAYETPHLVVLALTLLTPTVLAAILRAQSGSPALRHRLEVGFAWGLAILLILQQALKIAFTLTNFTHPWVHYLPLHLCDLVLFISAWALITRQQWAFVLAYFWGLAGTIQGLLTPDLGYGFPHPYFIFFFLSHGGIVAAALYLVWGCKMRPQARSILYAWFAILGYAAVVYGLNAIFDTNYGYLNARPNSASLLDHFWDPPAHIIQMAIVALIFFCLLYLPFAISQKFSFRNAPQ